MHNIMSKFDNYVDNYDKNDSMIKLKFYHSYRVMDLCKQIAENLNLSDEDIQLAMIIGLLHDYARFEQWYKYNTFSDNKSIDHGDLAVKLLFEDKEIENFNINKKYYSIIYDAIKYHNKYSFPDDLEEKNKLFCKIIRDADKLDIFYLWSIGEINRQSSDAKISKIIDHEFYENKLLNKTDSKSVDDAILLELAMIYDFNFEFSYEYLKRNRFIDSIYRKLDNQDKFKDYFDYAKEYIEKREKVYVRKKI